MAIRLIAPALRPPPVRDASLRLASSSDTPFPTQPHPLNGTLLQVLPSDAQPHSASGTPASKPATMTLRSHPPDRGSASMLVQPYRSTLAYHVGQAEGLHATHQRGSPNTAQ